MKIFFLRIYFALRSIATHSHFQMSSRRYDCSNFIRSTGDKETSMKRARDETTKKLDGQELNDAIYRVVMDGNVSGLRELLEMYDDVTERGIAYGGWKALHLATQYGHVDVAKLLIKKGADVNAVANTERSVLYWASFNSESVPITLELVLLVRAQIRNEALTVSQLDQSLFDRNEQSSLVIFECILIDIRSETKKFKYEN